MASLESVHVVIAAYNEGAVIRGVVEELRSSYANVIVVDDASSDDTVAQARLGGAIVLRHLLNRGQGAALQTGIDFALRTGAEVIVTFDGDGQHRAEDIARLVDELDRTGADVAIGSRFLGLTSNVPPIRRLLLRIAAFFMRLTSGVPLSDAHNGLRALRRDAARRIRIRLDRMAHASEIVDQFREQSLRVVEVPVVIRYSDYSRRKGQSGLAAFRIAADYLIQRWFR